MDFHDFKMIATPNYILDLYRYSTSVPFSVKLHTVNNPNTQLNVISLNQIIYNDTISKKAFVRKT